MKAGLSLRGLTLLTLIAVIALAILGRAPTAFAQPAPQAQPPAAPAQVAPPAAAEAAPATPRIQIFQPATVENRDRTESSGTGMALLFWAFAFGTIGGALFVITRRNLIAAVMGMVGTFFAVAGLYMMLYANFLAVVQMLVYAGAIMVLFVFVVMVLNKPEDEPWALTGVPGKVMAGLAMLYLTVRLGQTLWSVKAPASALIAPNGVLVTVGKESVLGKTAIVTKAVDWGSVSAVGTNLFDQYLFPFEAISILLLVAVVGAIAIARPLKDDEDAESPEVGSEP